VPESRAFRFVQFEFPWALGPADGRYVVRDAPDAAPTHVLVLATLGAPERRRLRDRRGRPALPQPPPTPVATARATVIDASAVEQHEADRWLAAAGVDEAIAARGVVARAVRAHRVASADPSVREPALSQALVVRAGHGAGEQVAEGRWSAARELSLVRPGGRATARRGAGLRPQERFAALLGGHAQALVCEELTLRARQDLEAGDLCQAALQLRAALEAALAELSRAAAPSPDTLRRVAELRERAPEVTALADAALVGGLPSDASTTLEATTQRLEAALRAAIAASF